jgi:hypothetical protein
MYYRWRNQFGGMNANDAKWLKDLERENAGPRRLLTALGRGMSKSDVGFYSLRGPMAGRAARFDHHLWPAFVMRAPPQSTQSSPRHVRRDVAVDVSGDADAGMAQHLRGHL